MGGSSLIHSLTTLDFNFERNFKLPPEGYYTIGVDIEDGKIKIMGHNGVLLVISDYNQVVDLLSRVSNIENNYQLAVYYEIINSGSSGAIIPPTGGSIVLDNFAGATDAIITTVSNNKTTWQSAYDSNNVVIAATLDGNGNYNIVGTPLNYPICLIYFYKVKTKDFDYTKSIDEVIDLSQGDKYYKSPFNSALTIAILGSQHQFGRIPNIVAYDLSGQLILGMLTINDLTFDISITFNRLQSGTLILT